MTAQQIAAKMAPLGCSATPAPPSTVNLGGIKAKTELECTINGEDVSIDEYLNAEQVSYNMKLAQTVGCSFAKQFGFTGNQEYVLGFNWIVTPKTASTAQSIKNAIGDGAKITVVHCK
jgi:hypothetical protein